jgi:hypothetical protein
MMRLRGQRVAVLNLGLGTAYALRDFVVCPHSLQTDGTILS